MILTDYYKFERVASKGLSATEKYLYISHAVENWSLSAAKSTNGCSATVNARTKN